MSPKYVKGERLEYQKRVIWLLTATIFVLLVCFTSTLMAWTFLGFKYQLLVSEFDNYKQLNQQVLKTVLGDVVIWEMDESCAAQFENPGKVHLMIEKVED